jgi:serine/threonine protein kinase
MDHAEQNLAQILPGRPLTPEEVRDLLPATLDALAYLHGKNLVQGGLKPPNFLAVGDQLKLASDTIRPAGARTANTAKPSLYDPPGSQERQDVHRGRHLGTRHHAGRGSHADCAGVVPRTPRKRLPARPSCAGIRGYRPTMLEPRPRPASGDCRTRSTIPTEPPATPEDAAPPATNEPWVRSRYPRTFRPRRSGFSSPRSWWASSRCARFGRWCIGLIRRLRSSCLFQ